MTQIRHHIVVLTLLTAFFAAPSFAESQEDWAIRALELQEHIDIDQPFNRTFWVGTHNSYNAHNWSGANQSASEIIALEGGTLQRAA